MSVTITSPTSDQQLKGGQLPHVTVFFAVLPTLDATAARFTLDGSPVGRGGGLVLKPIRQVAVPGGDAFVYALVATIPMVGQHLLRVENLDMTNTAQPIVRGFAETRFSLAIDPTVAVARGSELIAAHLREVDPHGQYLTEQDGNTLYRAAGGIIPEGEIAPSMATDAEVRAAVDALKAEPDPLPQYVTPAEGAIAYQAAGVIPIANIPSVQATDAEVDTKIALVAANIKTEVDAIYRKVGVQISVSDVAPAIATDAEVSQAIDSLKGESDPLPQYLTPAEGATAYRPASGIIPASDIPLTQATDVELQASSNALRAEFQSADSAIKADANTKYRKLGTQIPEPDIDSLIARDSEVSASISGAVSGLKSESDPLPQYLLPNEGDAKYQAAGVIPIANIPSAITSDIEADTKYRKLNTQIPDADVAGSIARDTEVAQVIANLRSEADPFPKYLDKSEGDVAYRPATGIIPASDIPSTQATDAEFQAADAALKAEMQQAYPAFKRSTFTLNCPARPSDMTQLPHGINSSKIKSFSAFATVYANTISEMKILPAGGCVPWIGNAFKYWVDIMPNNIVVRTDVAANSQSILGVPVVVVIDHVP